jgi:hypothetical protein
LQARKSRHYTTRGGRRVDRVKNAAPSRRILAQQIRDHGDRRGPAASTSGARSSVMPPIATTGVPRGRGVPHQIEAARAVAGVLRRVP